MKTRPKKLPAFDKSISRRRFVASATTGAALAVASPVLSRAAATTSEQLPADPWPYPGHKPNTVSRSHAAVAWHDVSSWGVEGRAWSETARYFDRLPARSEGVVRQPVWDLSRHSAGMCSKFETDSRTIHVRYTLLKPGLAMPHMPATGVSGLDLYAEDSQGVDRWVNVVRPTTQTIEVAIADGLTPGLRKYTLYLPLYNGVESLEIGVDESATFNTIVPRTEKSIVFYGTSIMHGACASRPGMAIPAILGRRLKMPVVNLGFSGNGKMEPEVADLLSELDPCVFVVDCVPNMNADLIDERAVPLVRRLKKAHPKTPVLLVEDRAYTNTPFFPKRGATHRSNREALRRTHQHLMSEGVEGVYYLAGKNLLGNDGEGATDGSHPSDLGMVRYADAYEPALRSILKRY